jgi:predicted amidohydrolase
MTANLRVTMIQADLAWQDPATNRRNLAAQFRGLAGHTDLIVLPEMFTTGFSMEAGSLAETMAGATVAWLREESAAVGCAITGSLIVEENGQHYNRLVWATPDGGCAHYDKRHLFRMAREQEHYASGNQRLVVKLKGWRNRDDYDVLLYVANWPSRRRSAWSALLRARAIENACYVVGVNRVGKDGNGASYSGDSVALDFLGQVLGGDRGGDFVETVVLDRESLATFRRDFPVHLDADDFDLRAVAK